MTRSGIPLLQNSNSIAILMWLLENDGSGKQQLYDGVSHTSSMSIRVDELVSAGLIDIEPPNRRRRSSVLWLTDSGKAVAEHLKTISELIGERSEPVRCGWPEPEPSDQFDRCGMPPARASTQCNH